MKRLIVILLLLVLASLLPYSSPSVVVAADLPQVTVDSTISSVTGAFGWTYQRRVFYSATRFWVFFSDGTDMAYSTSVDSGTTWSAKTTIRACSNARKFSIWYNGTYVYYSYTSGSVNNPIYYRRGTPISDGTITWSAAEQTAKVADASWTYYYPFISADTSGYPVVSYYGYQSGGSHLPYVIKGGQTDGTWASTTFTKVLSSTSDATWRVATLPLAGQDLISIYARAGQTIRSEVYDFGTTTWGTENSTGSTVEDSSHFSAVVDSSNVVHLVYLEDISLDIMYTYYASGGTSWSAGEEVYNGASLTPPVLSVTSIGLVCSWIISGPSLVYKSRVSSTWDVSYSSMGVIDQGISFEVVTSAYEESSTGYVPICVTETTSPYSITFSAKDIPDGPPVVTTQSADYIAITTARINGYVNYAGDSGTCYTRFQYGVALVTENSTSWVAGRTTGSSVYESLTGLTDNTTYKFRVQAYSVEAGIGSPISGSTLTFLTSTPGIGDPSDLFADPASSTSIELTWITGDNSDWSVLRYSSTDYADNYTDGLSAYSGPLSVYTLEGLTPGTTYFFRVWGSESSHTYYSDNYSEAVATTPAGDTGTDVPYDFEDTTNWFTDPDCSGITGLPAYDIVSNAATGIGWSVCVMFVFLIFITAIAVGMVVMFATKGNLLAVLIAMGLVLLIGVAAGPMPKVWFIIYLTFAVPSGYLLPKGGSV